MLLRRLFLCALLVGACSGLLHAALQRWQVVPLILAAEVYESAAEAREAHPHDEAGGHEHGEHEWQPADGLERTAWTVVANMLAATGYALLLVTFVALWDRARGGRGATWRAGLAWGTCAWLAAFAVPALGLPPELPGIGAAALHDRQAWWLLTLLCSAVGLALVLLPRSRGWLVRSAGVALLVLPFAIGAPQPGVDAYAAFAADAPQMHALESQFVRATVLATAVYWLSLGVFSTLAAARWIRPLLVSGDPAGRTAGDSAGVVL